MRLIERISHWTSPVALVTSVTAIILIAPRIAREAAIGREVGEVARIIRDRYVEETDPDEIRYAALSGMLDPLDPYSDYLPPELVDEMTEDNQGRFGGLGILLQKDDQDRWKIEATVEDKPAFRAGIHSGDWIVAIDGMPTDELRLLSLVRRLKGEVGTEVTVTMRRPGRDDPWDVTIVRAEIKIESIKGADIIDEQAGIGYVRLIQFQENTPKDFDDEIADLSQRGMRSLVLDLRSNPGGLLTAALDLAERFLPRGDLIVKTVGRDEAEEFRVEGDDTLSPFPLVVLINQRSASASEILAAAIQDHRRGLLLGARTFGKASVQSLIPVGDGRSRLKLTTARYQTPSGRFIHRDRGEGEEDEWGLMPDLKVALFIPDKSKAEEEAKAKNPLLEDLILFQKIREAWQTDEYNEMKRQSGGIEDVVDPPPPDTQLTEALRILRDIDVYRAILEGLPRVVKDPLSKTARGE